MRAPGHMQMFRFKCTALGRHISQPCGERTHYAINATPRVMQIKAAREDDDGVERNNTHSHTFGAHSPARIFRNGSTFPYKTHPHEHSHAPGRNEMHRTARHTMQFWRRPARCIRPDRIWLANADASIAISATNPFEFERRHICVLTPDYSKSLSSL